MTLRHLILVAAAAAALIGCSKPPSDSPPAVDPISHLAALPPADARQVSLVKDMKNWRNPYLVIRVDGIGLLDPANNEMKILAPDQVVAALAALPASAWPYGKAVAIAESGPAAASESDKAQLRKNRALVAGSLEGLHILINWVPST